VTSPVDELTALDPVPDVLTLADGRQVRVVPLHTRQVFKLFRIIAAGAGAAIGGLRLDPDEDTGVFLEKFAVAVLTALPEAEQQTIDFLQSMVEPVGLRKSRAPNRADREHDEALWQALFEHFDNPPPEDTVTLIEAIVRRDGADLQALGKRLAAMFRLAQRMGAAPTSTASPDPNSSERSPEPTISSPASTDGPTPPLGTSRSEGSASL